MNRLLSIIIPFHKYVHYLEDCLLSLKESSFKDFEVLVICDRCEDDITNLINEYATHFSLRVHHLDGKQGVAAARNAGIQLANGEYIFFLDSDDYIIEHSLSHLMAQEGVQLLYGKRAHTWNKRANYLANIEPIQEEGDNEIEIEVKVRKVDRFIDKYKNNEEDEHYQRLYFLIKSRKGFGNISVLGNAFKRTFLMEHNITFDETYIYYSDLSFMTQVLDVVQTSARVEETVYVKRKHNDPINHPSLTQIEDEGRFFERMNVYEQSKKMTQDVLFKQLLDDKLINYIRKTYAKRIRRSLNCKWREQYYPRLVQLTKQLDKEQLKHRTAYTRKLIASIQQDNLPKTLRIIRNKLAIIKFKNIWKSKTSFYKLAYYHLFTKMKLKENVVLFESFMGKNYSDSPKYIYEYLAKHHSDKFKFVWVLNNRTKPPYQTKVVKRFSFRYAYYLAVSKYLVFNVRQPLWYRKQKGQVFVETWHGTPLKRLVFDQEEVTSASPKYKQQFYKQRVDWDYLVSANDFSTTTLRRCFMFENEMLDFGYPRNDILYSPTLQDDMVKLKHKLGIPLHKKTVLYAPTWRDDEHYAKGKYKFTLQLDLANMQKKLGEGYVVLLRMHHYISDAIDTSTYPGFVYNLSDYDDISEIYTISDICITDYSSVFFDYANLRRPILFFTYDIEKYKNLLRGFYIDMENEVPGPLLFTSDEVIEAIANIEQVQEEYKEKYNVFYNRFCHLDDGKASQKIVEKVFLKR